jgi:hypothetical protein
MATSLGKYLFLGGVLRSVGRLGASGVLGLGLAFGLGLSHAQQRPADLPDIYWVAANTTDRESPCLASRSIILSLPIYRHEVTSFRNRANRISPAPTGGTYWLHLLLILLSTSRFVDDFTPSDIW